MPAALGQKFTIGKLCEHKALASQLAFITRQSRAGILSV
jgi:hypothetical protein